MSGYANKVKKLDFSHLSDDPEKDPVWVVIKNPKLQPMAALQPASLDLDAAGEKVSNKQAVQAGMEVAAKLIIALRVYDATTVPEFDAQTGEEIPGTGSALLPLPAQGDGVPLEVFAKMPSEIQLAIMNEIAEAANPPKGQDAPTPKT